MNAGLVGLAISYALSVTNLLSGVVTSFTETEKEMVSVERAMQYIKGAPRERDNPTLEVKLSSVTPPPHVYMCIIVSEQYMYDNIILTL